VTDRTLDRWRPIWIHKSSPAVPTVDMSGLVISFSHSSKIRENKSVHQTGEI
jgi:hypothetical protein